MMDSLIDPLLLAIFLPIAGYKIFRFGKKFRELAVQPLVSDFRKTLERAWSKS